MPTSLSKEKIEFVDTMVSLNQDRNLKTDVKKSIPYGLGILLKRICTDEKDYWKHHQQLKQNLRRRGYSSKFLEQQWGKADNVNRVSTLQKKQKKKKESENGKSAVGPDFLKAST